MISIIDKIINKLENIWVIFFVKTPSKKAEFLKKHKKYRIGNECEIFNNVSFGSEPYLISIGDRVKITANVQFITHDGGMYVLRNLGYCPLADKFGEITIGNNVFIGNHALILPGVKIGDNCVIGARAVVTKNIPSGSVVAGVPAKVINNIQSYYEKNKDKIDLTKDLNSKEKKQYLYKKYDIK